MAINIGPFLGSMASSFQGAAGSAAAQFTGQEVKSLISQAVSSAATTFAYSQPQVASQTPLPKQKLMGGLADVGFLPFTMQTAAATFPARLASREALTTVRMQTGLAANLAGGVEGEVFSATIGEATAGLQSFVNVLTVPNVSNFATFMEHLTTAPQKLEKFGEALLNSRKELVKYSPEYAIAQAEMTVGQIERQMESAQRTGPQALELARSLEGLKDTLQPIRDEVFNVTSGLIQKLIPLIEDVAKGLEPFIPVAQRAAEALIEIIELMLRAVPWDAIKGALSIQAAILDALSALVNVASGAASGVSALSSLTGAVSPLLFAIDLYIRKNSEEDYRKTQEELAKMNEEKALHAQNMIRSLLHIGGENNARGTDYALYFNQLNRNP